MPDYTDARDVLLAAHRDLERVLSRLESVRGNRETAATGGLRVGAAAAVVRVAVEHALASFELFFPAVRVETALGALIAEDGWVTPGQVLAGPQPPLPKILLACEDRLRAKEPGSAPWKAGGEVTVKRLIAVRDLLRRAVRIEEAGRRGREKLRQAAERSSGVAAARRPED